MYLHNIHVHVLYTFCKCRVNWHDLWTLLSLLLWFQEGDRLGTMRVPEFGGSLIIFINGMSIGVMATGLPEELYGFVELRGDNDRVAITENSTVEEVSGNVFESIYTYTCLCQIPCICKYTCTKHIHT